MDHFLSSRFEWKAIWYKCLVCQRCFQFPTRLRAHKQETECGLKYPPLSERNIWPSERENGEGSAVPLGCTDVSSPQNHNDGKDKAGLQVPVLQTEVGRNLEVKKRMMRFKSDLKLRSHKKQHEMAMDKLFFCYFCKKGFHWNGPFNRHILLHTRERNLCKVCNRGCGSANNLQKHSLILQQSKPNVPSVSPAPSQFAIRSHGSVHIQRRSYRCIVCRKTCLHLSSLKHHQLAHNESQS